MTDSGTLVVDESVKIVKHDINYPVSLKQIAALEREYMALTVSGVDDQRGCQLVHEARMNVKQKRVAVEKRRKELKADALAYGRQVDAVAKQLTEPLQSIELYLQEQEDIVAKEKQRIAEEKERQRQAEIKARIDKLAKVGSVRPEAELAAMSNQQFAECFLAAETAFEERKVAEAKAKAEADAERERQRIEAERLAKERAALEAERAKAQAEREALEAEKRRIEKEKADAERAKELEKARAEAAEQARLAEIERHRREAEEKAERERREAEAKADAERKAAEEKARQEALRPDKEKILAFANDLASLGVPDLSNLSKKKVAAIRGIINRAADEIRALVK